MSNLPGLLGEIADLVGPEIALEIAHHRGGTRIDLPLRAQPDHWLTKLVGFDAADKICRGLATTDADGKTKGAKREVLPLGPASARRAARRRARDALDRGASVREAAREAGLHERTLWRYKAKDDDDQGSLF